MDSVFQDLPATEHRLEEIRVNWEKDPICQEVAQYCKKKLDQKVVFMGRLNDIFPVSLEI